MFPRARECLGFLRACKRASVAEDEQGGPGGTQGPQLKTPSYAQTQGSLDTTNPD